MRSDCILGFHFIARQIQRKMIAILIFFLQNPNILIFFCFSRQLDYILKDMGKRNNHKSNLNLGTKLDKSIDH